MFFHKTPLIVQWLYPKLIWSKPTKDKVIYLTFDDGPIPELTEFILETLPAYKARGTFFCVGDNLKKHKTIAAKIIEQGHKLGNHTFNHLNGWQTETETYIDNIALCQNQLDELGQTEKMLRPPYGRISRSQISKLKKNYKIIMWDVLSGDFSAKISPEECLADSIKATKKGSIVLFHDNIKASKNMKYTLPRYLDHFASLGYQFKSL